MFQQIAAGTAGGCPNYPDTWFQNPQYAITLPAAADLVGVLSLSLRPDESEELSKQQAQLTQAAAEAARRAARPAVAGAWASTG